MVTGSRQRLAAVAVLVLVLASAAAFVMWPVPPETEAARQLHRVLASNRPTAGRLAGIPYAASSPGPAAGTTLSKIQLLLLEAAREPATAGLEPYLAIARLDWSLAAARLESLYAASPDDFRVMNDLGVVYLELAGADPTYLPRAFERFAAAAAMRPEATEPRFNLALAYHRLHLDGARTEAMESYRSLEAETVWVEELNALLAPSGEPPRENGNDAFWERVVEAGLQQKTATTGAIDPTVLERYRSEYGDRTPLAIFSALESGHREAITSLRQEIQRARDAYAAEQFERGIRIIDDALERYSPALDETAFDTLWSNLNRAEMLVQTDRVEEAAPLLERIIEAGQAADFKWLVARAMTAYGSHPVFGSRLELIHRLETAIDAFDDIGNVRDSLLARAQLATALFAEGSNGESFAVAHTAVGLSENDAYLRRFQLTFMIGLNPLLAGSGLEPAFLDAAVRYAELADSPRAKADAYVALARFSNEESPPSRDAERYLILAEDAVRQIPDEEGRVRSSLSFNLVKAQIRTRDGRVEEGIELLRSGLAAVERQSLSVYFSQRYYLELANARLLQGREVEAEQALNDAVAAVEAEDDNLGGSARLTFDEFRRHIYEVTIAHSVEAGHDDVAWRYAQQYRNKLLSELVQGYAPVNDGFATLIASDADNPAALEERTVLEYMLLEDRLLIWVVSPGGLRTVREVPLARARLTETAERFLELLTSASGAEELERLSRLLYRELIEPVGELIGEGSSIVIVPDRILHRLPFQALLSDTDRYLVEDHTITQTPSLRYYLATSEPAGDPPKLVSLGSRNEDAAIRVELQNVAATYSDIQSVDGFDVTRAVFLDSVSGAWLLHYAGHSAVDGINALTSAVRLGGNTAGAESVTAVDIANRRMAPGALVVLSSCDSSVGNSIGGVGVRGLTSAFLIAGAGAVVGSLWPVESRPTADLMISFHRRVSEGAPIAEALREAQLELMRSEPHPYYWSGFNVTGNSSTLEPAPFISAPARPESARLSR